MYSGTWRSEAVTLDQIEDWKGEVATLYIEKALSVYLQETDSDLPSYPDSDCEYELDNYHHHLEAVENAAEDYFNSKYPSFVIDGNTQVVTLCNYKGEGEGIALLQLSESLPVYSSKRESYNYKLRGIRE
jgi:hypothetical protein